MYEIYNFKSLEEIRKALLRLLTAGQFQLEMINDSTPEHLHRLLKDLRFEADNLRENLEEFLFHQEVRRLRNEPQEQGHL